MQYMRSIQKVHENAYYEKLCMNLKMFALK